MPRDARPRGAAGAAFCFALANEDEDFMKAGTYQHWSFRHRQKTGVQGVAIRSVLRHSDRSEHELDHDPVCGSRARTPRTLDAPIR
jgi:hypothetical protein